MIATDNVEVKVEVSTLIELSLDKTVNNFNLSPFRPNERLNPTVAKNLHERLPLPNDGTVETLASFVDSTLYWKRACGGGGVGNVNEHGGCDKRQFFETNIQSILITSTDSDSLSEEDIAKKFKALSDFIHTLCLSDIQHSFPLEVVCSSLTNLQHINLKQVAGLKDRLPAAIESSPYLTTLIISESQLTDDDAVLITTKLADSQTLLHLDLSNNKITANGVQHTCEKLLSSKDACLTHLDLSGNPLESKGAKVIGKTLSNNNSLISLSLRLCMIGDEGAESLFESLTRNATLNHINLSANRLGSSSAETLLKVLETNEDCALESLVLASNMISDDDDLMQRLREYKECFIDVRDQCNSSQ